MNTVKDRLNELIKSLNVSKNEFAREIGTSSAMISKITTKDVNFGFDIFKKIISRYPDLNKDWLLNNVGEIWMKTQAQNPSLNQLNVIKSGKMELITKENASEIIDKSYIDTDAPFYLERHAQKKIWLELLKGDNSGAELYKNINKLMTFYYIVMNLDHYYFENIDKKIHDVTKYYNGKTFDYEQYRNEVTAEIEKYMTFNPALSKLIKAIDAFYLDAKEADYKNIIDGYLNP